MIHTHFETGGEIDLRLTQALLVYTSEDWNGPGKTYLEIRPVHSGPDGPEFGAGFPADAAALQRMLLRDVPAGLRFMNERLLAVGEGEAAWWTPAGPRSAFFAAASELGPYSGDTLRMPALIYHVRGHQLRIRALACRGRPGPRTPLYVAPLWNIYEDGTLCVGTMPIPKGDPAENTLAWEEAFWDAAFTTPHHARLCAHPRGYRAMIQEMRELRRFPTRWLVPTRERLEQWLTTR